MFNFLHFNPVITRDNQTGIVEKQSINMQKKKGTSC